MSGMMTYFEARRLADSLEDDGGEWKVVPAGFADENGDVYYRVEPVAFADVPTADEMDVVDLFECATLDGWREA